MSKAVLVDGVRTPFGRFMGGLSAQSASDLGAIAVNSLVRSIPVEYIDGVILAQIIQAGQGQNPARQVAVRAGLPLTIPAMTLNNVCLASMETIADAVRRIERKEGELFVVGGFESMSNAPHAATLRHGKKMGSMSFYDSLNDGLQCALSNKSMGIIAEDSNQDFMITREAQDNYAVLSQTRAKQAQNEGRLADEIVKVPLGREEMVNDECIRKQTTIDSIGRLQPAFNKNGTVTAGNASQISDGASAGLIASEDFCIKMGRKYLAEIIDWITIAGPDHSLHSKPAQAIYALLNRTNMQLANIDLFEINEAFAGVVIASHQELGVPLDRVNVNGGAIALGHPLAASGFRLVLTLAKELKRRGGGYGIASLCGGGGQGMAILIKV